MTRALLTPRTDSTSAKAGARLYWKQILPLGGITYQGRRLTFDRPYLTDLARAFDEQAYDAVPAVLADPANAHNMDPTRMRGEVRRVEVRDDGLYGLIDLAPDAAELVERMPRLGVSARIVESLERADGRTWPRALQHVLLTADPRVTGMGPWQAVDLSSDPTPVLDLSGEAFTITQEESHMATLTENEEKVLAALLAKKTPADAPAPKEAITTGPAPVVVTAPPAPAAPVVTPKADELPDDPDSWTDEQLNAFIDGLLKDAPVEPVAPAAPEPVGASLSTPLAGDERARIAALELSVAQSRWRDERQNWVAAGVPPHLLDKAAPVLSVPAAGQIDLSNGTSVDPFSVIRDLLDAAKGTVDLSAEQGSGRGVDTSQPTTLEAVKTSETYKNWSF